jgi:hypothetical protein
MATQVGPEFEKRIASAECRAREPPYIAISSMPRPTILAGPETAFFLWPFALQQARADRVAARVNRSLELGADVIAEMIRSSTSSVEAFDRMMAAYGTRAGVRKTAWAEKTPWNCLAIIGCGSKTLICTSSV